MPRMLHTAFIAIAIIALIAFAAWPRRRGRGGDDGTWSSGGSDVGSTSSGDADCGPGDSGSCDGGGD
jgi:hypothetical protein